MQLLENNSSRLNYNGNEESEGGRVDAAREAFERKDYGGRFKPLQRSGATEFHLLSIHGDCDL